MLRIERIKSEGYDYRVLYHTKKRVYILHPKMVVKNGA